MRRWLTVKWREASESARATTWRWKLAFTASLAFVAAITCLVASGRADGWGPLKLFGLFACFFIFVGRACLYAWRLLRRKVSHLSYWLLGALGLLAIVLSAVTFEGCSDGIVPVFRHLYHGARMLLGEQPDGCESPSLTTELARYLSITVALIAVIKVIMELTTSQVNTLTARLAKRVTLVVGLNEESMPIVSSLVDEPDSGVVVVWEPDSEHSLIDNARRVGACVIVQPFGGDDRAIKILKGIATTGLRGKLALQRAYLLDGDDGRNIARARLVEEVLSGLGETARNVALPPTRVIVRIDRYRAARYYVQQQASRWSGDRLPWAFKATLGTVQVTARAIVERILEDHPGTGLCIVGISEMAEALGDEWRFQRQVTGYLAATRKTGDAELPAEAVAWREQESRGEALSVSCIAELEPALAEQPEADRFAVVLAGRPDDWGRAEIECLAEKRPQRMEVLFAPHLTQPWIAQEPLFDVLYYYSLSLGGASPKELTVDDSKVHAPALVGVPQDSWDRAARVLHEGYRAHGGPTWVKAHPTDRVSNFRSLWQTLHSACALGYEWRREPDTEAIPERDMEHLIADEHRNWYAFKMLTGWAYPTGKKPREGLRENEFMVPWDELQDPSHAELQARVHARTLSSVTGNLGVLAALGFYPHAVRYERTGEVMKVRTATEPETWSTEAGGEMTAEPGDVILTAGNRTWSIKPDLFDRDYELIVGHRYRRRGVVRARRAIPGEVVDSLEGKDVATVDQWYVQDVSGDTWLAPDEHFRTNYKRLSPSAG